MTNYIAKSIIKNLWLNDLFNSGCKTLYKDCCLSYGRQRKKSRIKPPDVTFDWFNQQLITKNVIISNEFNFN